MSSKPKSKPKATRQSKPVTIADLARALDISVAAVSKALNDLPGVSDPLRLKVKKLAASRGYAHYVHPNVHHQAARSMRFITVIYGRAGGHLMEQIQSGVDQRIRQAGYYELRYLVDESKELYTEARKELFLEAVLKEKGVAGVLVVFAEMPDNLIAKMYRSGIPVVLLNNYTDFGKCVTIDNRKAMRQAVARLVELGHRRIGCIMAPERVAAVWRDRHEGYRAALKEHQLPYNPEYVVYEESFDMKQSGLCTRQLLTSCPDVTAIVFGSDLQAFGGLKALKEMGKRVPDEVAILGFDDLAYDRLIEPSLSSIAQPIEQMGELGIKMLLKAIEGRDFAHEAVTLETKCQLRGSCLKDYREERWFT